MKQHQFFNVNLAYKLDSIIQDIGEWNGIQFMLQSKYGSGYRTKTAPTDSCGILSCLQVERNGKQRQIAVFSQNCNFEAEKIDLETISQTERLSSLP